MDENKKQKIVFKDKDGNSFSIPPQGSLGLLALGDIGLTAWRQVREQSRAEKRQEIIDKKNKNKA